MSTEDILFGQGRALSANSHHSPIRPGKFQAAVVFLSRAKLANWIQPCCTCYFYCLLKDMPVLLKEPVYGDSHSEPQSVGLLKSPLRCLPQLSRGEGPAKCHFMTEASTCTIGKPVVVACLPHLAATRTTAYLKCCWSKACLAFGIKLHWIRQESRATVMEGESMSPHRALQSTLRLAVAF